MKTLYETHASATGGRNGRVPTDYGVIDLQLAMPTSLGGAGGAAANPEQLFACGYAACFDSALNFVAMGQKIKLTGTRVDATVGIGQGPISPARLVCTGTEPGVEFCSYEFNQETSSTLLHTEDLGIECGPQ